MEQKTSGRGMRVLLGISLALNLLVVGVVVGSNFGNRGEWRNGPGGGGKAMRGTESAIGIYGRALSKSERRAVGRAIRASGRDNAGSGVRALRGQLRALAGEAVTLLRADDFDAAAFRDVLNRQQGLIQGVAGNAQTALVDYVDTMSGEARAAYADRLEDVMTRGPKKKRP